MNTYERKEKLICRGRLAPKIYVYASFNIIAYALKLIYQGKIDRQMWPPTAVVTEVRSN